MNEDFKKIAKGLGVVLPACLLSIGVANAETLSENELQKNIGDAVCKESNVFSNNYVVKFLTMNHPGENGVEFGHTNRYTDVPANHTDDHDNVYHSDDHTNRSAVNDGTQCKPHTDNHSDRAPRNSHTNNGNRYHSDSHTDIPDARTTCD